MLTRSDKPLSILGVLAIALTVGTCKGDMGSTGPMGTAGPTGPTGPTGSVGRAYAIVTTTPSIVTAKSKNVASVRRPSTGVYCVTPAAGISPANSAAFVTVEWAGSAGNDLLAFIVDVNTVDCTAAEFDVRTYTGAPPALGNNVAFQILIP